MNRILPWVGLTVLGVWSAAAQVTITATDFFNRPGLYYRAYANNFNPLTGGGGFAVGTIAGSSGPDQFWDFSAGPQDKIFRFDYLAATNVTTSGDFPEATVAEQKTDETSGGMEWLFFDQVPQEGRKVYGFYAENPLFTPSNVFQPPMVDFPAEIRFGQEWATSTVYINTVSFSDNEEGGLLDLEVQYTLTSKFKVDAHGTIVLPDELGVFGPGLRITEEVTIDLAADLGEGGFEHLETDYTRNFYWVMPHYGIVAQLNSVQSSSPPPENFARATAFLRMFETNKKPTVTPVCQEPAPVGDLRIRFSGGQILLTWSKAECAARYVVQYTTNSLDAASWRALGDPTADTRWVGENAQNDRMRFYRVVSLK